MKVAIVGAGIAGSFLGCLLEKKGISPDVYEKGHHDTVCGFRSCGWGAPSTIGAYLADTGLDLDDYLLESMKSMEFDGLVARTPLCTLDKPGLIRDLRSRLKIIQRQFTNHGGEEYDVVVDATGISRAILPPCTSDLTLPTLQHRVFIEPVTGGTPGPGVYGSHVPGLGYIWVFPLGRRQYHIGAGGLVFDRYAEILDQFLNDLSRDHGLTRHCTCPGKIRVACPFYSQPMVATRMRENGELQRIIGVGESIGTVSPFTGEGIIYSMECAKILADSWLNEDLYVSRILSRFAWMRKERETLDYLLSAGRDTGPRLRDRWRFYRNARRSGVQLPLWEAFRRMGSLTRWIEG
ncbi:MAG TPA: NAD(P)/FAD-dependent oxidoreductase [Methanolinea sp.]|nr:NAD(P)/FAD-dependent oxidoreductase [Methanolinea sp.]HQK56339.1 NAD(P)/FAD-dependent oxidoreductase [Methanolinea sp.]